MGKPNLQIELYALIKSFTNMSLLMYELYSDQIKYGALLLIAIFSFKLGKITVTDPLEKEVREINFLLRNRQQYTEVVPKKIKSVTTKMISLLVVLVLATASYFVLREYKPQVTEAININIFQLAGGLVLAFILLLWVYQLFLKFKISRGNFNDHRMNQNLKAIVTMLGPKVELLLKAFLCRQAYGRFRQAPAGVCSKDKCKEYRSLLKEKSEIISVFVENVLNFEWCSVCRKRPPFDEFLSCQINPYNRKEDASEEQQVNERNGYLLGEIEKMSRWGREVGACNCSMRYWGQSKNQIKVFKVREKEVDQRIALFEARQSLKR